MHDVGSAERKKVRLISREIIFEEFQHVWSQSTKVTGTDRQLTMTMQHSAMLHTRGRQSPAGGPNPAREFRPSSPRQLVSFNIKFVPENVLNDERLFSR